MSLPRSLYKWDKQIGEGAFGKVYAAVRKSDGLKVAVKEVSKSKMTARCEEVPLEVVILQQVRDIPGLATIQDWHETRDCFYIVMERSPGLDLFDYISSQGSLTEQISRKIFWKVRISPVLSLSLSRLRYWRGSPTVTGRASFTATSRTRTSSSSLTLEP